MTLLSTFGVAVIRWAEAGLEVTIDDIEVQQLPGLDQHYQLCRCRLALASPPHPHATHPHPPPPHTHTHIPPTHTHTHAAPCHNKPTGYWTTIQYTVLSLPHDSLPVVLLRRWGQPPSIHASPRVHASPSCKLSTSFPSFTAVLRRSEFNWGKRP